MTGGPSEKQPLAAWRFAGGAFLHFIAPAYILALLVGGIESMIGGVPKSKLMAAVLPLSACFLAVYGAIALVTTVGLAVIGRLRKRTDPDRAPRDRRYAAGQVRRAIATARGWLSDDDATLDYLALVNWEDDAPTIRKLAADLVELVERSDEARKSASPNRRDSIVMLAREALCHLATFHRSLVAERSALDEGDARTIARYVETRYGPSDFAGDS